MKQQTKSLTQERLKDVLNYCPESGAFVWIKKSSPKSRIAIGSDAGSISYWGYIVIEIDSERYQAHRLAWLYMYSEWPKDQIDHINGIKVDNRIENLRDVTNSENHKNMRMLKNNTSGIIGVTWNKKSKRWQAQIVVNKTTKCLGLYSDKNDAITARQAANKKYGFHENHGKPVPDNYWMDE